MNRSSEMKSYIPSFLRSSQVFTSILTAEGAEFGQLRTNIEDVLKQFYVETATDWGLTLWERMLGLKTNHEKPLDQRRSSIIAKVRGIGTVTISLIKNVAESFTYGIVEIAEQPEAYSFTITFADIQGIPPNYENLQAAIEEIKPAHLAVSYVIRYLLWDELDAEGFTWNQLDALAMAWDNFEQGGWLDA